MLRRKRLRVSDKGCVALCVDNMRRVQELSPIELVEMFVTVFCFLKDSSDVSQVILDDFRSYQGYNFLAEFLLKYVLTSAVLSIFFYYIYIIFFLIYIYLYKFINIYFLYIHMYIFVWRLFVILINILFLLIYI